jgi:hypothetical protein
LQLVDCRFTVAHHHQKRFIIEQYNRRERDSKAASAHQIKVHTQPNFLHAREKVGGNGQPSKSAGQIINSNGAGGKNLKIK